MEHIVIEPLREEDRARYTEILLESYQEYEATYPDPDLWQSYVQDMRAAVQTPKAAEILVAKQGSELMGGVHLFTDSGTAYGRPELGIESTIIRLLAVHPKGRGQGVGKRLIQAGFAFAQARGDKSLYLHSGAAMVDAIKMYESLGFVRDVSKEFYKGDIHVLSFRYDL